MSFIQQSADDEEFEDGDEAREYFENSKKDCIVFFKSIFFSVIKRIMEILSVSSGDILFVFGKEKILMNTLNKNQGIIIHLELNAKDKMVYNQKETCSLAVNSSDLYKKCFKIKDRSSILYWRVLNNCPKNFKLSYLSGPKGNIATSFNLLSKQNDVTSFSFKNFNFTLKIEIKSATFHRLLSERYKTETFELILHNKTLNMRCCNTLSFSRSDRIMHDGETVIFPDQMPEETKNKKISFGEFNVGKLNLFYKTTGIAQDLILHLNTLDPTKPICTQYLLNGELGSLFVIYKKNT